MFSAICVQQHNTIAFVGTFPDACETWNKVWFLGEELIFYSWHNFYSRGIIYTYGETNKNKKL